MPEELCQVSPKLHYVSLASHSDPNPYILFSSNLSYIVSFCQSKAENTPWFATYLGTYLGREYFLICPNQHLITSGSQDVCLSDVIIDVATSHKSAPPQRHARFSWAAVRDIFCTNFQEQFEQWYLSIYWWSEYIRMVEGGLWGYQCW